MTPGGAWGIPRGARSGLLTADTNGHCHPWRQLAQGASDGRGPGARRVCSRPGGTAVGPPAELFPNLEGGWPRAAVALTRTQSADNVQ